MSGFGQPPGDGGGTPVDIDDTLFSFFNGEADYNDTVNGEIQQNLVYPIFEILVDGANINVYNYVLADNDGDPDETTGRVLVDTLSGDAFEAIDMTVDLDHPANGLVDRIGQDDLAYFMLLIWDGTEWHYYPIGINAGLQSNVIQFDASIAGPPAPAGSNIAGLAELNDQIRQIYLHHVSADSRIILAWYNDDDIVARVQLPWQLSIRRVRT